MSGLLANLLLFGRVLRGVGLHVDLGRMIDLVEALRHVGIGSKADFRHAARCLLVRRREEFALFDAAFEAFWRKPREGATHLDLRALGEQRRFRRPRISSAPPGGLSEGQADPSSPPVVRPILAVHGAQVPWGKVLMDGVPVVPAKRLPSMLGQLPAVLGPQRVADLANQARVRFHAVA